MSDKTAIVLEDVGYKYSDGEWILRNINIEVKRGEALAVLGPNGRGKTTLINIILGAIKPCEGSICSYGKIGFVPQIFEHTFPYRVIDMVLMGRASHIGAWGTPSKRDYEIANECLMELDIHSLSNKPINQLSGGERQMVMFARALASEGDILILDEPASALDLSNQTNILSLISKLANERNLSILFTTHQPQHALAIADKAILLMQDNISIGGPVSDVLNEETLSDLYGVKLHRVTAKNGEMCEEGFMPIFGLKRREYNESQQN